MPLFMPLTNMLQVNLKSTDLPIICEGEGCGGYSPSTFIGSAGDYISQFNKLISSIIGAMTIGAGIYFIFLFIVGAYGWMTGGGNKEKLQIAQNRIVYAIIGIAIVVAAYGLISIIGELLGLDILNPRSVIEKIGPGGSVNPAPGL